MAAIRWICWAIFRLTLAARYRLVVRGKDKLRTLKGPVLVLPNHPGYIDPFLLFVTLCPSLRQNASADCASWSAACVESVG